MANQEQEVEKASSAVGRRGLARVLGLGLGGLAITSLLRERSARADAGDPNEPATEADEEASLARLFKPIEDFVKSSDVGEDGFVANWAPVVHRAQEATGGCALLFGGETPYLATQGSYPFTETLHVFSDCRFIAMQGLGSWGNVFWKFSGDGDGVIVHDGTSAADLPYSASAFGGIGSVIEGIHIWGPLSPYTFPESAGSSTGNGVTVWATCHIRNCDIRGFGGDGIHIEATSPKLAENWRVESTVIQLIWGIGLYVAGGDASPGTAIGNTVANCGLTGIVESSQLGNTYIACVSEWNNLRGDPSHCTGYISNGGGDNSSLFLGCHADDGDSSLIEAGIVIGGNLSRALTSLGYYGNKIQASVGTLLAEPAIAAQNAADPGNPVYGAIGSPAGRTGAAFEFGNTLGTGYDYTLRYSDGWWLFNYAGLDAGYPFGICTSSNGAFYEKNAPCAKAYLVNGTYLNGAGGTIYVAAGPAAPTSGTWAQGDRVLNSAPTGGGNEGWVCTEGGSPGTWKEFGSIAT